MKYVTKICFLPLMFSAITVFGQWSNDPENPLLLCTVGGNQSKPIILTDNNEGNFIFWLDNRSGISNIYGQHLDKIGNPLWETDGKLIVESLLDIAEMNAVINNEGNILLAWHRYADTLFIQKYNSDASAIWASPTKVAGDDATLTNTFWGPTGEFAMLANGDGCFLAYNLTGWGYDNLLYNKVAGNGSLPWGYNGLQIVDMSPSGIGKIKLFDDGAGGAYLQSTRGLFYLSRFDGDGNLMWGETPVNECTGGTGGTYASHTYFEMQPDDENGWIAAWTSASDDVYAARINQEGDFVWDTDCKPIFENPEQQEDIAFTKSGDGYYATWKDSRPDAPGIYMQKINNEGITQWAEPLYIEDTSLYIPVMKSIATTEGEVVVFYQTSGYFAAQKVFADGSTTWPQPLKILDGAYKPFYEDYQLFTGSDNNVIGVAQFSNGLESDIVMFNLNWISGDTIPVDPVSTITFNVPVLAIHPNPANNALTIHAENPFQTVVITDMHGNQVFTRHSAYTNDIQIDINALLPGMYFVKIATQTGYQVQKLVKN